MIFGGTVKTIPYGSFRHDETPQTGEMGKAQRGGLSSLRGGIVPYGSMQTVVGGRGLPRLLWEPRNDKFLSLQSFRSSPILVVYTHSMLSPSESVYCVHPTEGVTPPTRYIQPESSP